MKRIHRLTLLVCCVFTFPTVHAQIPNPGFEQWSSATGTENPEGWEVNNIAGFIVPVTRSSEAHSGSSALKGEVVEAFGGLNAPFIWSHFPHSTRADSLTGYYKYTSVSSDSLVVVVWLLKGIPETLVAWGVFSTATSVPEYTRFTVPLRSVSSEEPDAARIEIVIAVGQGGEYHSGTGVLFDTFAFDDGVTALGDGREQPTGWALEQNYPNPFNPSTTIRYRLPVSGHVTIKVHDVHGREVATLIDAQEESGYKSVRWDAAGMASGVYFCRLQAGGFTETRKLLLMH